MESINTHKVVAMTAKSIDIDGEHFCSRAKLKDQVRKCIDCIGCTEDWSSIDPSKLKMTAFLWQVMKLHPNSATLLRDVARVALRWNSEKGRVGLCDVWLIYENGKEERISVRTECVYFEQTEKRIEKEEAIKELHAKARISW